MKVNPFKSKTMNSNRYLGTIGSLRVPSFQTLVLGRSSGVLTPPFHCIAIVQPDSYIWEVLATPFPTMTSVERTLISISVVVDPLAGRFSFAPLAGA